MPVRSVISKIVICVDFLVVSNASFSQAVEYSFKAFNIAPPKFSTLVAVVHQVSGITK